MSIFVYCPKSGSRVFALRHTLECAVVTWSNGSRHVMGNTVDVRVDAPGRRRAAARAAAEAIVLAAGGAAWDDRGEIHVALPRRFGARAARLLGVDRPSTAGCDLRAMAAIAAVTFDPALGDLPTAGALDAPRLVQGRMDSTLIERISLVSSEMSHAVIAKRSDGSIIDVAKGPWRVQDIEASMPSATEVSADAIDPIMFMDAPGVRRDWWTIGEGSAFAVARRMIGVYDADGVVRRMAEIIGPGLAGAAWARADAERGRPGAHAETCDSPEWRAAYAATIAADSAVEIA